MASRAHLLWQWLDEFGNRIPAATVEVFEPGTTTKVAETIYVADDPDTGVYPNPFTSDANGIASFFMTNAKRVDLRFSKSGYTTQTIKNLDVTFPANRFLYRNLWVNTTAYAENDVVRYDGQSWVALRASTGVIPVEGADWSLIAAKGASGSSTAATVSFTPAGGIAATDVQAAIQEVVTDTAAAYQALSGKGAANGYAPLGVDSKVPAANLPTSSGTGDLLDYQFVRKIADESVTSSTVLQNDDHLLLPVLAGETWEFEVVLFYPGLVGAEAMDIKVALTFPAMNTIRWSGQGHDVSATGASGPLYIGMMGAGDGSGASMAFGLLAGRGAVFIKGVARPSASGNIQVQWAQNFSNANPLTILTDSYLTGKRFG